MTGHIGFQISPQVWLKACLPLLAAAVLALTMLLTLRVPLPASCTAVATLLVLTGYPAVRLMRELAAARCHAQDNKNLMEACLHHTPLPILLQDEHGVLVYANPAYSTLVGKPLAELAGAETYSLWPAVVADALRQHDCAVLRENVAYEWPETVVLPSGEARHYLSLKFPFVKGSGRRLVGSVSRDATERQGLLAEREAWQGERRRLEEAVLLTQFAVDHSSDSIIWLDRHARIAYANDAACSMLGYPRGELLRMAFLEIDGELDTGVSRRRIEDARHHEQVFESAHITTTGVLIPVDVRLHFLECSGQPYWCWISGDITERKRASEYLGYRAGHDELTGLPNRRLLESTLEHDLAAAAKQGMGLAVLVLDLDGFNLINKTLGHQCGDQLLRQAAERLAGSLPEGVTLARMGGDEFSVLVTRLQTQAPALEMARRLLHSLHEGFLAEGHELLVTASVGISMFPRDGRDANALLRSADSALYAAKRKGKDQIQFFTPEMNIEARERLELETLLRRALERQEFLLHFQPQISLATNEVVRYEALLRWDHPVLGLMLPDKFISIAEETGLIEPIGRWVLEEACRQIRKMQLVTGRQIGVAVNVSTPQFLRGAFLSDVVEVLHRSELPAHLLELELTETIVMQDLGEVTKKMQRLRDLGVTLSIDDFGTGYSALSYLQRLPVHSVKIDRSFLRLVPEDEHATSMLGSMVSMAHGLGMKVVIEGVERAAQLVTARDLRSDLVQGYYVARPAPLGTDLDITTALHHLDQALSWEHEPARAGSHKSSRKPS